MKKLNLLFKALLIPVDVIAIILAFATAYWLRSDGFVVYLWPFAEFVKFVLFATPIWILIFTVLGVYSFKEKVKTWEEATKILIGSLSGWAMFIVIIYFIKSEQTLAIPRLILLFSLIISPIYIFLGHFAINCARKIFYINGKGLNKIMIVGKNNELSNRIIDSLQKAFLEGFKYSGLISESSIDEIIKKLKGKKVDEVWVIDGSILHKNNGELIDYCEKRDVGIRVVPESYELRTLNVKVTSFAGVTFLQFLRSPLEGWGRILKRFLDIIFSLFVLIILSPIFLIIALLVKLSSSGPVLYSHTRVGQDGKEFNIFKFRTMYQNAEKKAKHFWSVKDESKDPRITTIGLILRKSNLDELPQIFNVFSGVMSWVGPRPEQPGYVDKFSTEVPNYLKRHYVKSGITGWAQINGLRGDTSISERVKYDLFYIQHWSLWFDFRIMVGTVIMTLRQIIKFL